MNKKIQLLCAWSGPCFMGFLLVGFWFIAHYVPPHSPNMTAAEVAAFYQASTLQIRVGLFITMFGSALYLPWSAVISDLIARIEGRFGPLSMLQFGSGALTILLFAFPTWLFAVAAFRPERDPELILLINDVAWLCFVGLFSPFFFVPIAIGVSAFLDKHNPPIFPRWVGYFNLWMALLVIPGGLTIFFKSGAFAWNGLLAFWVPLTIFGIWFTVMFLVMVKAIKRLDTG